MYEHTGIYKYQYDMLAGIYEGAGINLAKVFMKVLVFTMILVGTSIYEGTDIYKGTGIYKHGTFMLVFMRVLVFTNVLCALLKMGDKYTGERVCSKGFHGNISIYGYVTMNKLLCNTFGVYQHIHKYQYLLNTSMFLNYT